MGEYFNIPLGNNPALIEIQEYLKTKLPTGTIWQEPGSFHITLVYLADGGGEALEIPTMLPVFGLGGFSINLWETPEGWVVIIPLERSPQLTILQGLIFYAARAAGLAVGNFSWPGLYRPHITMGTIPVEQYVEQYCELPVPLHLQVEAFELSREEYEVVKRYELLKEYAGNRPVSEMAVVQEIMEWSFKGKTPEVPIAPGVNVKELVGEDSDPFFVTLPAYPIGEKSANGRIISADESQKIIQQIVAEKPDGIQGHLTPEERNSKYPMPVIEWVGAIQKDNLAWVKGYVPPGEVREMLRRKKAKGANVSLSIYGTADHVWDSKKGAWMLHDMSLETIDLAPPKRSGFGLAAVPHVTAEMAGSEPTPEGENEPMVVEITPEIRRQVIAEMTVDQIPDAVRQAIQKEATAVKVVAEMRGALGIEENADVVKVVKEMADALGKLHQDRIEAAVVAEINAQVFPNAAVTDKEDDPIKAARALVREMMTLPDDADKIAEAVKAAMEKPLVKAILQKVVVAEMGPSMGKRGRGAAATPGKVEDTPETRARARAAWGF